SAQRRNQKVIEETPAPGISSNAREQLWNTAERLTRALRYQSAGTVEFLYDCDREEFFFLEVNTRLQVEHGVTEEVTGIDIVEWMVNVAAGAPMPAGTPLAQGAAIQARLYAEDPQRGFQPSAGVLTEASFPDDVRIETAVD